MMLRRSAVAAGLFVVLVGLGLLSADKPPPVGFIVWVAVAGVAAGVVWWRAPRWRSRWAATRDGAVVGLLGGLMLVATGGEPSVDVPAWAAPVTVAVLTLIAALVGWLLGLVLVGRSRAGGET